MYKITLIKWLLLLEKFGNYLHLHVPQLFPFQCIYFYFFSFIQYIPSLSFPIFLYYFLPSSGHLMFLFLLPLSSIFFFLFISFSSSSSFCYLHIISHPIFPSGCFLWYHWTIFLFWCPAIKKKPFFLRILLASTGCFTIIESITGLMNT